MRIFGVLRKREEEGCEVERSDWRREMLVLNLARLLELEKVGDGCSEGLQIEKEELEGVPR